MNTKRFFSVIFSFAFIFLLNVGTSNASEVVLNDTEIEKLRENYISLGIDEVTGEKLIQKVLNGELLDSQNPEKIKEKEHELVLLPDGETNIIVFDDGSRIALQMEEENLITPYGYSEVPVSNSCSSGSGYNTCTVTVKYNDLIWTISYKTTVTRVQGGQTTITDPRDLYVDMVLYDWLTLDRKATNPTATSSKPARTAWKFKASHKTGLYTVTRDLAVYATNSSIYARLEWQ
ncbi:hypothetical protein U1P98_18985 [Lysinibacillus irui]|uniref:Uncharacterized protein n=1 Tax=Lysinibacillus irui TaxID=2998077 RepID=A0ABU5NQS0_9BACI|nr:hypothetical protein [Lysinibacillus irui]MEA0552438.1 hypothetical protein [Lysinibacillus irui]MEA0978390.1 hypothetical protein [Lysinibacillus irui]MEA1044544.1 hypothetical protein [Lysinibacillus irui]